MAAHTPIMRRLKDISTMQKIMLVSGFLVFFVIATVLATNMAWAYPSQEKDCSACHGPGEGTYIGTVTATPSSTALNPGAGYTVEVTISKNPAGDYGYGLWIANSDASGTTGATTGVFASSGASPLMASMTAPSTPGTYYYKVFGENGPKSRTLGQTNFALYSITVTNADVNPPILILPPDTTMEGGAAGAVYSYTASATDPEGSATLDCSPPSGSTFPVGITTVNCTAEDTSGNTSSDSFTVTVIRTFPVLSLPANITTTATGPAGASVSYTVTATDDDAVTIDCSPPSDSTFPLGTTWVNCTATDTHGNSSSGSFNVTVEDDTAPIVADLAPSGTISTDSAVISAYFSDAGSGINSASASVYLDGGTVPGCIATDTGVSCAVSGLADGDHSYTVTVNDYAGNSGTASGSFSVNTCTPERPELALTLTSTYWASYSDYTAGLLSVDYSISNGSVLGGADNVTIAGSINTSGVTMASATAVGDIGAGNSAPVTIKYNVPAGVRGFKSTVYVTANDLCNANYAYPGPYPGT